MSVFARSGGPPVSLTGALLEAELQQKKGIKRGVAKRLKTAASILDKQDARSSVALLKQMETLDSEIAPVAVQIVPGGRHRECLLLSQLSPHRLPFKCLLQPHLSPYKCPFECLL